MDRLRMQPTPLLVLAVLVFLASCGPEKAPTPPTPIPVPEVPATPTETLFPTPYFPVRGTEIAGRPLADWAADWTAACLYSEDLLNDKQKAWVAELGPAGGEGKVAPGFTADFDGDGKVETVAFGAFAKASGDEGNFVLLTREAAGKPEVLLLEEFAGPPKFTVFTLKPDGSLWFGGGIDAGEVTMNITWDQGKPAFHFLTGE